MNKEVLEFITSILVKNPFFIKVWFWFCVYLRVCLLCLCKNVLFTLDCDPNTFTNNIIQEKENIGKRVNN